MDRHPEPALGTEGDAVGRRVVAIVLDTGLYWLLVVLGGAVAAALLEPLPEAMADPLWSLLGLAWLGGTVYFWFLMEGQYGRRPGKAAVDLVVVTEDGSRIGAAESAVRNLLWIVDSFGIGPFVVALVAFVTERNQRVGDLAASTVVVRTADSVGVEEPTSEADVVGVSSGRASR